MVRLPSDLQEVLSDPSVSDIEKSAICCIYFHRTQTRKTPPGKSAPMPYFYHPFEVAKKLHSWGVGTPANIIAANGHDLLEDTGLNGDELLKHFENKVAVELIQQLTRPQAQSKSTYLQSFATASIDALLIKIADRICNVADFAVTDPTYSTTYAQSAVDLVGFLYARKTEVVDRYGVDSMTRIHFDVYRIWGTSLPASRTDG